MNLKKMSKDKLIAAGIIFAVVLLYGLMMVDFVDSKFQTVCSVEVSPLRSEKVGLYVYVLMAAFGCGLAVLEFWPNNTLRPRR